MKRKNLFLMCGPSGAGKSTWIKNQVEGAKFNYKIVSRDAVRFSMVREDEDYFSHEDEVFEEFCRQINEALESSDEINVFVDATHLSEKARNKTLDKVNLEGVYLYAVSFEIPVGVCISQNDNRTGRAFVPRSVIRRMHATYTPPAENEKYKYEVLTVRMEGVDNDSFYE